MPNIITHKIFAEEVLKKLSKKDIATIIEKHPQIYYIGSNGPDFLFFSHVKPWEVMKKHTLNHLGSKMHAGHVNAFYKVAIENIMIQTDEAVKENMIAYLFGHLCHWALDKTAHPYIFYRTGTCKGVSAGYHHRFESMMDTMMLDKFKGVSIKDYPCYEICEYDEDILKAIARIYVPCAKKVFHTDVKVHDLRETLNSWYDVQKMLYDPNNIKYPILKGVEAVAHQPWKISGNVVKAKIDPRYDVLNEEHTLWYHPCDNTISSHASFMDLFNEAVDTAILVIEKAYGCIEYGAAIQNVLDVLKDQAYDTGMDGEREIKYYDIIYEQEPKKEEKVEEE